MFRVPKTRRKNLTRNARGEDYENIIKIYKKTPAVCLQPPQVQNTELMRRPIYEGAYFIFIELSISFLIFTYVSLLFPVYS